MRYEIVQQSSYETLDLAAVKHHLRLSHTDDDIALTRLIEIVSAYFEKQYNIALLSQKIVVTLDHKTLVGADVWWNGQHQASLNTIRGVDYISLPIRPCLSLNSIQIINDAEDIVLDPDDFKVTGGLEPRLQRKLSDTVLFTEQVTGEVVIDYQAGFGDTYSEIPLLIRHGLLEMIAHLYMYRGDDLENSAIKSGAFVLWQPYKRVKI